MHLVTLLFDKPRDYSVAAVALLDEPLKIVSGHSLREADQPLYRAVEQLFRVRNKIVHSGAAFTKPELVSAINAAEGVGRYLNGLRPLAMDDL